MHTVGGKLRAIVGDELLVLRQPLGQALDEVLRLGAEPRVVARLPSTVAVPVEAGRVYAFGVRDSQLRFFDPATGLRTARRGV